VGLLAIIPSLAPCGELVSDEALASIHGGDLVYCALVATDPNNPQGCGYCKFAANCPYTDPYGNPTYVALWTQCNNKNQMSTLCATGPYGTGQSPSCNRNVRNAACGDPFDDSLFVGPNCNLNINDTGYTACAAALSAGCTTKYSDSTVGPNTPGVNCANVPYGYQ
jgi:hypothetical protein